MDPFLGEIRLFAGNFAPRGWAVCAGQLIAIHQNTALFSLLGTTYGGDGRTIFALPNFQGRAPMHWGNGAGLTPRSLGEQDGQPTVTLLASQLPGHTHPLNGYTTRGELPTPSSTPTNTALSRTTVNVYVNPATGVVPMSQSGTGPSGGDGPHNNQQPYLGLTFIIALEGIFPPRP